LKDGYWGQKALSASEFCQADTTKTAFMAARNFSFASLMAKFNAAPSPGDQTPQKRRPKRASLARSQIKPQNFPFSGIFDANGDHKRHGLYTPAFPNFRKGCVKPNVWDNPLLRGDS
jgi:hypothetical protein